MIGYGSSVRCFHENCASPQGGNLKRDIFNQADDEFGLEPGALEISEGQLSGYLQEAAESMSLGLSRVVGTGKH